MWYRGCSFYSNAGVSYWMPDLRMVLRSHTKSGSSKFFPNVLDKAACLEKVIEKELRGSGERTERALVEIRRD